MVKPSSEPLHSRSKHKARWRRPPLERTERDDDEHAAWRKKYYRGVRSDIDPQSTVSRGLEFVGLDEPYREDTGSYDYRQSKWDQSVAEGSPDVSWMLPELSDEQTRDVGGALERGLGYFNPAIYQPGWQTVQRPSQDERVLSQLSPEDRALVEQADPDAADEALRQVFPDWQPKLHPFPTSMVGTQEREGDKRLGWMPHFIDQWNYSPYSTEDILSFFTPASPETVRRDIEAWKGGSSALDRTVGGLVGVPSEGPETSNSLVDPVEIGSLGAVLGVPGMIRATARGAVRTYKTGKKVMGATGSLLKRLKRKPKPQPGTPPRWPLPEPLPRWPQPVPPVGPGGAPLATTGALGQATPGWQMGRGGDGTMRDAINRAMQFEAAQRAARRAGVGTGLIGAGALGGAGVMAYNADQERKKRRKR